MNNSLKSVFTIIFITFIFSGAIGQKRYSAPLGLEFGDTPKIFKENISDRSGELIKEEYSSDAGAWSIALDDQWKSEYKYEVLVIEYDNAKIGNRLGNIVGYFLDNNLWKVEITFYSVDCNYIIEEIKEKYGNYNYSNGGSFDWKYDAKYRTWKSATELISVSCFIPKKHGTKSKQRITYKSHVISYIFSKNIIEKYQGDRKGDKKKNVSDW